MMARGTVAVLDTVCFICRFFVAVFGADNAAVRFRGLSRGYASEFPMYESGGFLYCAFGAVLARERFYLIMVIR